MEVRARHVVDLFHKLRTDRERNLAQRTIYNIYTVVAALFRDAKLADLIEQSPCIFDERQLGPLSATVPFDPPGALLDRLVGRPARHRLPEED